MKNITLFYLCAWCLVYSQSTEINKGTRYHFTGLINGKYSIFMALSMNDMDVRGIYYYSSIGTPIDLEGTCARDGSFLINEFVSNDNTAAFKGMFTQGYTSASGMWEETSGVKKFPFSLTLIAGETVLTAHTYEVAAYIPEFTGTARAMQNLIADTITALFHGFLDDYSADMMSEPEWGWEFICDYTIEYYSEFFTSILLEVYEYTGGAHGNTYYICLNPVEEKATAEFLELEDLFREGAEYEAAVSEIIIQELKAQEAGWIIDGSVHTIDPDLLVFNITPGGLLFTFAPYAVGPYAEGPHRVMIPYKRIAGMIDTRGPIAQFIK